MHIFTTNSKLNGNQLHEITEEVLGFLASSFKPVRIIAHDGAKSNIGLRNNLLASDFDERTYNFLEICDRFQTNL